mgnify:CR=1 FL=1
MISKYIDFKIFIISLSFGLFLAYIFQNKKTIIYVYPTPDNIDKIFFKDKSNQCFKFTSKMTECPDDPNKISSIPVQN